MASSFLKRYRWDRIGVVVGLFLFTISSLIGWVSPDEEMTSGDGQNVLSHPSGAVMQEMGALPQDKQPPPANPEEAIKPCSCNRRVLDIPHNPYTAHRLAARNLPHSFFIKDKAALVRGQNNGKLVPVFNGRGYHIAPLTHSHKMLLPEANEVLVSMGHAFADELKGTPSEGARFRVSSITRTSAQQTALGRRNYNAIDDQSTHSYGASFDISFTDRPSNEVNCSAATRAIQKVLLDFQRRGKILIIPEGNCMHVTVRP